ncbi:MAG: flagellar assembly protein FliW [Chloroherpetonaceae bacterium]|nr:flagellar assembly protein FliW [Chthonomonadaceae bacterium]MDW8207709.1 flagellar assembly protein FliW [Chloroherpetonaceae bacterium]
MAITLDKYVTDTTLAVTRERSAPRASASPEASVSGSGEGSVRVVSTRFGELEVNEEIVITFPDGLIGFEQCQRFVVVRHEEDSAFRWLQSLDVPAVAFPIIEPNQVRPDYAPTISDADARALELDSDTHALLFVIVTVPPGQPQEMTVNLLGPLVINVLTRRGRQVIVQDEEYMTRHRVVDELQRAALLGRDPAVALKSHR